MTNHRRIALALNNLATVLQQLAIELTEDQAEEVVHPLQLTTEQLRAALVAPPSHDELGQQLRDARPSTSDGYKPVRPDCGCGLYARCDVHEATKPRSCKCNGPAYASSACLLEHHRADAARQPDHDPALVD